MLHEVLQVNHELQLPLDLGNHDRFLDRGRGDDKLVNDSKKNNTPQLEEQLKNKNMLILLLLMGSALGDVAPHQHIPRNPLHAHKHHGTGYHPTGGQVAGNIHGHGK